MKKGCLALLLIAIMGCGGSGGNDGNSGDSDGTASILGYWEVTQINVGLKEYLPGEELYFNFEGSNESHGTFTYVLHPIIDPENPGMTGGLPCPLGDEVYGSWINHASDKLLELEVWGCAGCWYNCGGTVFLDYEASKNAFNVLVSATLYPGRTFLISAIR